MIPALSFFAPIARLQTENGWLNMSATYFEAANYPVPAGIMPWGVTVATALLVIVNLWNIFCYKNRKKQIRMANWCIALTLIFYIAAIAYVIVFASETEASVRPTPTMFAPLVAMIFTLLARRAVKRDEALVRAADRIR